MSYVSYLKTHKWFTVLHISAWIVLTASIIEREFQFITRGQNIFFQLSAGLIAIITLYFIFQMEWEKETSTPKWRHSNVLLGAIIALGTFWFVLDQWLGLTYSIRAAFGISIVCLMAAYFTAGELARERKPKGRLTNNSVRRRKS